MVLGPTFAIAQMPTPDQKRHPRPLSFYALDETVFEVCWHEPPAAAPHIPESLVQDMWRLQQFRTTELRTTDGRMVEVLDPGRLNRDSGPDFLNARILLDGMRTDGPVEIHTASTAWYDHGHDRDAAYAGVALHVTLEHDLWTGRLRTSTGRTLPEIVLAPLLDAPLRTLLYNYYARGGALLPCTGRWKSVDEPVVERWIARLSDERLDDKVRLLESRYLERPNLQQLLYELVLTGLGYSKNSVPMLDLARRVPLGLLHELESLEMAQAALLGTAGLLPEASELRRMERSAVDYVMLLRHHYHAFRGATGIVPMDRQAWQFFRLRPSNFPTIRIAQAGALACRSADGPLAPGGQHRIRAALLHPHPRNALEQCFRIDPGPFWRAHVRLDRRARRGFPLVGKQRVHALFANAIGPVLRLQAEQETDETLSAAVTHMFSLIPAEDDEITRIFAALGWPARNGRDAQGLHRLYRAYCREGLCLSCDVGRALFTSHDHAPTS